MLFSKILVVGGGKQKRTPAKAGLNSRQHAKRLDLMKVTLCNKRSIVCGFGEFKRWHFHSFSFWRQTSFTNSCSDSLIGVKGSLLCLHIGIEKTCLSLSKRAHTTELTNESANQLCSWTIKSWLLFPTTCNISQVDERKTHFMKKSNTCDVSEFLTRRSVFILFRFWRQTNYQ